MDAGGRVRRHRRGEPLLERRQRRTDLEARVVGERQATGRVRAEPPAARLRPGAEHLQLAAAGARGGPEVGKQRLEVGTAADDHLRRLEPLPARRGNRGHVDADDRGREADVHAVGCDEVGRDGGDRPGRIDGEFGGTPEHRPGIGGDRRKPPGRLRASEEFAWHAEPRRPVGKLRQHPHLVLLKDDVHAPALGSPDRAGVAEFEPAAAASHRDGVALAGRLADRPDHAEVTDAGPAGGVGSFQERDPPAVASGLPREGEAHDPATDHDHIGRCGHASASNPQRMAGRSPMPSITACAPAACICSAAAFRRSAR